MLTYTIRRLGVAIPVLLVATFLLFIFVRQTNDPTARLAFVRDPDAIERERERLGLNDSLMVQYWDWLSGAVTGDLGESYAEREPVTSMIQRSLWRTVQLIFWGVLISAIVAISIGVYGAVRQYSVADYTFTGLSFVGLSMPPFWFAFIAIQFLVFTIPDWFGLDEPPVYFVGLHSVNDSGMLDYARHLVLPVATLTVQIIASWSRYQRSSMLDAMSSDYIRTARAKGVSRRKVIYKHGLRNALIPLVSVAAVDIGLLFGGLIITERIFSIPGMGSMFLDALANGDTPVLLGFTLVVGTMVILFNLLADLLYGVLDPRVRLS
jgi:peptide/nickel transport system permease protein